VTRTGTTATWDAIVVGGGHNGLVAAALLGQAGLTTLLVERRDRLGGAADTSELVPGARVPTLAHTVGRLRPSVVRALRLREHGLRLVAPEIAAFAPHPDGEALALWRSPEQTAAGLRHRAAADAEAWLAFDDRIRRFGRILAHLARSTPPDLRGRSPDDALTALQLARLAGRTGREDVQQLIRTLPMAVADLAADTFTLDHLRAVVVARGVALTAMGPRSAGTANTLLTDSATSAGGAAGQTVFAIGGPGAVTAALAGAARSYGVELRTSVEVARIGSDDGRTTGIILADGSHLAAPIVVAAVEPKLLLTHLVHPMEVGPTLRWRAGNYRTPGAVAKVNLALARLPRFQGGGDEPERTLRGRIVLASSVRALELAHEASKYGGLPEAPGQPLIEATIPSLVDPGLVGESARRRGVEHVLSAVVQWIPYGLRDGSWDERRDEVGDLVQRTLEAFAPGIGELIVDRQVITPLDLERDYGLTGGHPLHGEPGLDQFFAWRPLLGHARYRMPLRGLYLAGSGAHPGGGITGAPAENAVRELLTDLRRGRLARP
jgi:phytoene dehydrogenase-like protein